MLCLFACFNRTVGCFQNKSDLNWQTITTLSIWFYILNLIYSQHKRKKIFKTHKIVSFIVLNLNVEIFTLLHILHTRTRTKSNNTHTPTRIRTHRDKYSTHTHLHIRTNTEKYSTHTHTYTHTIKYTTHILFTSKENLITEISFC